MYAIGPKAPKALTGTAVDEPAAKGEGAPTYVQVSPTELTLQPGQTAKLRARLFDSKGRFLREEKATWSLQGLKGTVTDGTFVAGADPLDQAGIIKATVGELSGEARARIVRPLPITETFDELRGRRGAGRLDQCGGRQILRRHASTARRCCRRRPTTRLFKRMRMFMGAPDWSNYTVEADVRTADQTPAAGRRGHHGAAIFARAVWQLPAAEDRAVGARDDAHGDGAVRVEAGYLVSPQAARREPGRTARRSCAARPGRRAMPSRRRGRSRRADPIGNRQGYPGVFMDVEFGAQLDNLEDRGESMTRAANYEPRNANTRTTKRELIRECCEMHDDKRGARRDCGSTSSPQGRRLPVLSLSKGELCVECRDFVAK